MSKISGLFTSIAAAAFSIALMGASAQADPILVGLITKTNTNPFFVKMKEGFEAKAKELGVTTQALAGKFDGDNDGQVAAIEQLIAAGAKGIVPKCINCQKYQRCRRNYFAHHVSLHPPSRYADEIGGSRAIFRWEIARRVSTANGSPLSPLSAAGRSRGSAGALRPGAAHATSSPSC